jgi:hypothetical protein
MEANVKDLRETFKVGYEAFEASRIEANTVWDLYHNRHYTADQLAVLESRGQPAETFNVVKMFARMLVGYYSTIVNTIIVNPTNPRDIDTAAVLNDTINYIFEDSRFDIEGDQIKLGGMISGLLCSYTNVEYTGERDQFNRPINKVVIHHVADSELVLDPNSVMDDYSDAAYLHRFRWMSADQVSKTFGKGVMDKITSYYNFLNINEADFEFNYGQEWTGYYRVFDNYLIVHSVIEDSAGKRWSCFWHDEVMILKEEITYKEARWPYRVQKLHSSNKTEYYGVFREVIEAQRAINQALLKIQLMANSEKAYVQDGAVENIDEFTSVFNRVNAVIPVLDLSGIRIEKLAKEIQDQYVIVDKALDRIQRVLGINDSFLGMAYASDSGRKVKLQQSATIMSLRYVTARIEAFYRSLGEDIAALVKQYYTANQIMMVADEVAGPRWIEVNKPMMQFTGKFTPEGEPEYTPILLPQLDPASGDFLEDDEGNVILAPVSEEGTEFGFTKFQIKIESTAYNDEDEKAQLLLETMMSGQIGQMVSQVNPAGFFKMAALSVKSTKTKFSPNIAEVLDRTAAMLSQDPAANEQAAQNAGGGQQASSPQSKALKLPANTNEGV